MHQHVLKSGGDIVTSVILKLANIVGETGLYRLLCPGRVPVFMLHRVTDGRGNIPGEMTADRLRGYLRYLSRRGYTVLTMDELLHILEQRLPVPSKSVMFTIDDGFFDHHDVAASVFDEFGFALNFFLITGLLDGKLWPWDDQIAYAFNRTKVSEIVLQLPSEKIYRVDLIQKSARQTIREIRKLLKAEGQQNIYEWLKVEVYQKLGVGFPEAIPSEYRPMSWDDARSLRARGHGVYPHSYSHRILSTLSLEEKNYEICEALRRISSELEYTPKVFAYPTGRLGDYDTTDVQELKSAGFKLAFNTVADYVMVGTEHYELPRFSLPENTVDFLQIVNRFEALKAKQSAN
jgi:peptidoglycan/xylan/chitin deacetylase (PgdA/CDA1 family)